MECPTVRIKATTGSYPFTTINESDFDPAKHERYVEGEAAEATYEAEQIARALADEAEAEAVEAATAPVAKPKRGHK